MASYYKPIDAKREEFRKYLERAGVMDAVTKALVSLYEEDEKPGNFGQKLLNSYEKKKRFMT